MASSSSSHRSDVPRVDEAVVRDVLGYLNFSGGTPDAKFERNIDQLWQSVGAGRRAARLGELLRTHLARLARESSTFTDSQQAQSVIELTLDHVLCGYRRHHADLLFHLADEDFEQPFFLARLFEAVLAQGPNFADREQVLGGALEQLNDFLGYRPLAVLENGRKMEPYPHERFRAVPLYIEQAGVAHGKYHDLIERTLQFFAETPADILSAAHFDLTALGELALDVRAHDHTHPMNKRTNYMFGEWDPHVIDNRGRYRRFVVRKIVLDALLDWMKKRDDVEAGERLYDASAVLCGTILMASAISGSGPGAHDSTVTLTSLLPKVARQRDAFYTRLLAQAEGARGERLKKEAKLTRQPFGHVRQHLNITLAGYGAKQLQYRHLAYLYARMGYPEASREQAAVIPSLSARFESEIHCRLSAAFRAVDAAQPAGALEALCEVEDYLTRGIECGALIDPWNLLGFQGQFPLFSSREDSISDERAETLLSIMEQTFDAYAHALGEAAAQGELALRTQISERFRQLAERWDRYASSTVEDLPVVLGGESWESANHLADVLARWRGAGESAGDISFWRQHVDKLHSAKAYALVVDSLLLKRDLTSAMGLMMQWLAQAPEVGLTAGGESLDSFLVRWMQLVLSKSGPDGPDPWPLVRKLFDYLEANAGEYWEVPRWGDEGQSPRYAGGSFSAEADDLADDGEETGFDEDEEDDVYGAAYDGVVYRDSAADGNLGETVEWSPTGSLERSELEAEFIEQDLEVRLGFLERLAELWQMAGAALTAWGAEQSGEGGELSAERGEVIANWQRRALENQHELSRLMEAVWSHPIPDPSGDHDSNVEYDRQLQLKFSILHAVILAQVSTQQAQRCLQSCLKPGRAIKAETDLDRSLIEMYRGVFRSDPVAVRRALPNLLANLARKGLLYVPLDNGGHPEQVRRARMLQTTLRFLLTHLPRLGLLRETFIVLRAAFRMERASRPGGQAVTEFDSLFQTALGRSLQCVIRSSGDWKSGQFGDEDLVDMVGELVERYLALWLKHSQTMRISSVESLKSDALWRGTKEFIAKYGADLFQPRLLTPGNLRAILHDHVAQFLEHLAEAEDPLHPQRLTEDLRQGAVERDEVEAQLELIYSIVHDKFDRFVEYSTTTTQSDYGEMLFSLLDFLRLEAAYERDSWNLMPVKIAHEQLAAAGRHEACVLWEHIFESNTADMSESHLGKLAQLEKRYGMRLPSIGDHLNERFVKPLAVNRIVALVPAAMEDGQRAQASAAKFAVLRSELEKYLETIASSSLDVPRWVNDIEREIEEVEHRRRDLSVGLEPELPLRVISLGEMRRQLKVWNEPIVRRRKKE
jgi:hypothetical protein